MGEIGKKLHRRLASVMNNPPANAGKRRPGDVEDVETLVRDGVDPIHAVYAHRQQIDAHFAETVSQLPELEAFVKLACDAEDEYMPAGPPMSPLTLSYFTCWQLYDLRFGKDGDTLAQCEIDAADVLSMHPNQLELLRIVSESRMGIYEHLGSVGGLVRLRELITGDEFPCLSTSGYPGKAGELWYVRRLPPPMPEMANYHVCFTTPYILIESTKDDWTQFLERTLVKVEGADDPDRLHRLLKYGLSTNYWNEFVFTAYHHHQADAIFLAGIPDLKATLPHA